MVLVVHSEDDTKTTKDDVETTKQVSRKISESRSEFSTTSGSLSTRVAIESCCQPNNNGYVVSLIGFLKLLCCTIAAADRWIMYR
jgi:hypothetical protein